MEKSKIRKLLYALREEFYPKDESFLNNINQIKITLNDDPNSTQYFCLCKGEFINFNKDKKHEKYVIFSSEFQINLFTDIDELFLDSTFKICPKNWYQLLNLFGYIKKKEFYIPLGFVLMSSKNEDLYLEIFEQLKKIIFKITKKKLPKIKIMCDFELGLRRAIKNSFEDCSLQGCYFHYCKAIWNKIKKLHLFKKKLRIHMMFLSFTIKAYPFIQDGKREDYCAKIESFCTSLKGNYVKFNEYFVKYWKKANIFNFTELNNNTIRNRTNNICESFHRKLNYEISHFHPKISFLIAHLKKITKKYYEDYINLIISNSNIKKSNEENYISSDIIKFMKKFIYTHKENINIDSLNQYIVSEKNNFSELMISILNILGPFDYDIIDNLKDLFNEFLDNESRNDDNLNNNNIEEEKESSSDEKELENKKTVKKESLTSEEKYLINGDVLIEEHIQKRKKIKKITTAESKNLLDDLVYKENN